MSNSKLLKEAIADAKAVRETAIANAKIALEEAFTPRLQSLLSQKLQQEIEEGDEEEMEEAVEESTEEVNEEEVTEEYDKDDAPDGDASDIGDGDNKQPADDANSSSDLAHSYLSNPLHIQPSSHLYGPGANPLCNNSSQQSAI